MAREIERRSNNALKFKEGTLYPALYALERDTMIIGEWRREPEGRERKIYHITPAGRAALIKRTAAWNSFSAAIGRVIGGDEDASTSAPNASGLARDSSG
jgi:PadR family transcriptional regulator PadR